MLLHPFLFQAVLADTNLPRARAGAGAGAVGLSPPSLPRCQPLAPSYPSASLAWLASEREHKEDALPEKMLYENVSTGVLGLGKMQFSPPVSV